jgi:uncharacterized protein YodC (DUF2158 family)
MKADEAKVGDVVVLKSGGPPMTIESITGDRINCVWIDRNIQIPQRFELPVSCIKKPGDGNFIVAPISEGAYMEILSSLPMDQRVMKEHEPHGLILSSQDREDWIVIQSLAVEAKESSEG